jgi:hypothetical protein
MARQTTNKGEKKMEIKNVDTWTTKTGATLKVESGLVFDDYRCYKTFKLWVNGKYYSVSEPNAEGHMGAVKLTDKADLERVNTLIAKTESHPRWVTKMAKIERALKEDAEYDKADAAIKKTMGR